MSATKVKAVKNPQTKEVKDAVKTKEILTAKQEAGFVYEGQGKSLAKISTKGLKEVSAVELIASDKSWHSFSIGVLAGKLDADIKRAVEIDKKMKPKGTQRSEIREIFKGVEKSKLAALKEILLCERSALVQAWNAYLNQQKQKSPISVYGLSNALRWMAKQGETKPEKARPIKDALKEVIAGLDDKVIKGLPAGLYDLLCEYDLIKTPEEIEEPVQMKPRAKKKIQDIIPETELEDQEDEALAA